MSLLSGNNNHESDFEYWEFVHCAICFLPFVPDPANTAVPPSVPFWLTECGHTVCNNHLNADQSCAPCGAPSIQLVPLQRDMMPPMSSWFRSVPHGLDDLAHAAKFQQESMASLLRFYKRKCSQQHATINKTKAALGENKALRSQIEQLQRENEQLCIAAGLPADRHTEQRFSYGSNPNRHAAAEAYEPGPSRNPNGKRPLADPHQNHRTSSPRSIVTPLGPPRITLPPDHQQPVFPSAVNAAGVAGGMQHAAGVAGGMQHAEEPGMRPESSRFSRYAFQPPPTPLRPQGLRHQQQPQSHRRQQQIEVQETRNQTHGQAQQQSHAQQQPHAQQQSHVQQQQRMQPPPTPGRAHDTAITSQHQTTARGPFRPAGQTSMQSARNTQIQMPPPPPPAATPSHPQNGLRTPKPFPMSVPDAGRVSTSTGHAPSARLPSTANATGQLRSIPQTPSNRFFASRPAGNVSGVASRAQGYPAGGSTRSQFVPGRG